MIRSFTSFLLSVFLITNCYAQEKYDMVPTGLPETGVNRVLCMKNGNTVLLHFEVAKEITVKVFDSTHKQIASKQQDSRLLDLYVIKESVFKGLFEVNGEAVLFVEQLHLSKYCLIRLRFNATTGNLIEEKQIGESKSSTKRTSYFTMKNKEEDGYAILFSTEVPQFLDCKIYVAYYNSKHEIVKEVPINIDRKNYDYLRVGNASAQPNGICLSLNLEKIKQGGSVSNVEGLPNTPTIFDHKLYVYYIPKDSSKAISTKVDVSTEIFPYFSNYTYNPFAGTLNLLLLSYRDIEYKYGINWLPTALINHVFFKLGEHDMSLDYKWMNYKMATKQLQAKTDTTKAYEGIPVSMFTNENGLTTIISTTYGRYPEQENERRTDYNTFLGNIAITQLDDNGNELWATILPFSQRHMSYQHYDSAYSIANKAQSMPLFNDIPMNVYQRQFFGVNCYNSGKNTYIVFNGNDNDPSTTIESKAKDTVYNYSRTNTFYYKLCKREVTKHYVFGTPAANEYKCSFVEGADFDDKRGVYASLVQYRKGDNISLRMAWSQLE
ncbi:MAG: hypothetical protein JWQ38_1199 [Flavipsychrobacter sp.]|nr:hypothetical protein [Flavipsychrobacter sp.]